MANQKITQLNSITWSSVDANNDVIPIVDVNDTSMAPSGTTKKISAAQLISSKQDTLQSGTNIKTINSTSILGSGNISVQPTLGFTPVPDSRTITINGTTQDLTANRTWTIPTIITVGTTTISSGTVGRILFEGAGNVIQEDAALFWDNTNKRLGVGATPSTSVRLDVRAQGALSTDIAFRVRNSADSVTLAEIQGTGTFITRNSVSSLGLFHRTDTTGFSLTTGTSGYKTGTGIEVQGSSVWLIANNGERGFKFAQVAGATNYQWNWESYPDSGYNSQLYFFNSKPGSESYIYKPEGSFLLGYSVVQPNGTLNLGIKSGVEPTQGFGDGFVLYSKDITAGNAAPHFRTENGDIVKLYRVGGWGLPTGTLTRTTFDSGTVTLAQLAERVAALITDLRDSHGLLKA